MGEEKKIGVIEGYYTKIEVALINLEDELAVGDSIHIKGHTTDFTQQIESMQIDRKDVEKAGKGDTIGIKVKDRVRSHDVVFKV